MLKAKREFATFFPFFFFFSFFLFFFFFFFTPFALQSRCQWFHPGVFILLLILLHPGLLCSLLFWIELAFALREGCCVAFFLSLQLPSTSKMSSIGTLARVHLPASGTRGNSREIIEMYEFPDKRRMSNPPLRKNSNINQLRTMMRRVPNADSSGRIRARLDRDGGTRRKCVWECVRIVGILFLFAARRVT